MATKPVNSLPPPSGAGKHVRWGRLYACAQAEAVVRSVAAAGVPALVVAPDMTAAHRLKTELRFFSQDPDNVFLLPDWETLPYDVFSPREEITAKRVDTLHRLPETSNGTCVVAADTLLQYVVPAEFIRTAVFSLKTGDVLDFDDFRRKLADNCYAPASQVTAPGEYAVRGSIIDFHPPGNKLPVRVDLFDDRIESLRLFSPEDQTSVKRVDSVLVQPAREFNSGESSLNKFRRNFRAAIEDTDTRLYHDVSNGVIPGGIEYYLPLFFDEMSTLFDYLPDNTVVFLPEGTFETIKEHWRLITQRHEQARLARERPPLPPERLFMSERTLRRCLKDFASVEICSFKDARGKARDGATRLLPALSIQEHTKQPLAGLKRFLENFDGRVLIAAKSLGYREQLTQTLHKAGIHVHPVEGWQAFCESRESPCICVGDVQTGAEFEHRRLALVSDGQILGRQGAPARRASKRTPDADAIIRNLDDLTAGCPIVHEEHGVGRYRGLECLDVGGERFEFLVIEYAGGAKLYVPVSSLHLVTRYTGGETDVAPLHELGGDHWRKAKKKAAQKAFDVAAELLDVQARRKASKGVAYAIDDEEYLTFSKAFPYEETPDQLKAMEDVRADMHKDAPMDRIVCGDVGFGKTEVAMRAAFIAVNNDRQVAVLVPTTLLATQHFDSFTSRFADWPVRIEMLSRFVTRTGQREVLDGLAGGEVDVVIGTHRLLTGDVKYKRLGLIVIDEEQRFGVRHKERLKSLAAGSDVLTLTATPIPRTLNMSLSGLRDLSLITTPPPNRRAIKTFVNQWDDALVCEICRRERHRGGQIYLVHNRVEDLEALTERLRKLLPEMDVRFAHGQMRARKLEAVMLDFYRRRFDVLVCTTIIESGLDVPSANSIIINNADRFGLAQMHQMRGRVGRSHYQAYAYLALSGPRALLPGDARKRLEAVESIEEIGAGFTLATHDLEIRGAGELLGDNQSGHIQQVGFTMYNDLLKRAIETLKSGKDVDLDQPLNVVTEVDLGEPALIPEDYLPDVNLRLVLYRRIAATENQKALEDLKREMIDRFGLMPAHALNLFTNAEIRLRCFALGIRKLEISAKSGSLQFGERSQTDSKIDVEHLVNLVRNSPETYRFSGGNRLIFDTESVEPEERRELVHRLLDRIDCRRKAA